MKTRILIADDDPVCRLMLEAALGACGHEVVAVADGDEAWRLLDRAGRPTLAVLDWDMPGPDGLELCRRIRLPPPSWERSGARERLVYAILLTGKVGPESVVLGLEAGAHDYITKPFDPAELHARVRVGLRVLGLQEALAARVRDLEEALARVKQLQGLLPMCCYCKRIRADQDYWQQVEHYICAHADVQFSHGICPSCYEKVVAPQLSALRKPRV
jgi:DNA-binding response OmpR family regulator